MVSNYWIKQSFILLDLILSIFKLTKLRYKEFEESIYFHKSQKTEVWFFFRWWNNGMMREVKFLRIRWHDKDKKSIKYCNLPQFGIVDFGLKEKFFLKYLWTNSLRNHRPLWWPQAVHHKNTKGGDWDAEKDTAKQNEWNIWLGVNGTNLAKSHNLARLT